jgi:tetraacyldisaccharide 4'-kinase
MKRPWLYPFVPLYAAALALANALRRAPRHLQQPVISIGSLSAGGAGKTPVVLALAKLLQQNGHSLDILSRGYGRRSAKALTLRVDPTLPNAAARFGDEPTLLATKTGAPVWISADRHTAGQAAEYTASQEPHHGRSDHESGAPGPDSRTRVPNRSTALQNTTLHLLDDGFQHRRLARTLDLVLITLEDLDDTLLPAGNLREPFSALRRASVLVVRQHERDRVIPRLKPFLAPGAPVWIIRRQLHFDSPLAVLGAGLRPLAFCALARPADFSAMVQAAGCGLVDTLCFPDHHLYEPRDIDHILATATKLNITGFVTTEKDAVKLTPAMRDRLATVGPLLIAELRVTFGDPALVLSTIRQHLELPA